MSNQQASHSRRVIVVNEMYLRRGRPQEFSATNTKQTTVVALKRKTSTSRQHSRQGGVDINHVKGQGDYTQAETLIDEGKATL
jgi:hypothetical protein